MAVVHDKKTGTYRLQFTDWTGTRRTLTPPKGTSKRDAEKLFARISGEQLEIRKGFRPPPRVASKKLFSEALAEYLTWGNTQGGNGGRPWSKVHAKTRPRFLKFWGERLNLVIVGDLEGSLPRVEKTLQDLQKRGVGNRDFFKPLAGKTINAYIAALTAFCRWCDDRGYLDRNPLKGLQPFHAAPITQRRALTPDEIRRLLAAADPARALLYELAIFTGLRAGELQELRIGDFDPSRGGIILHAEWTKNRKPGFQIIPTGLAERLSAATAGRGPKEMIITERFAHNGARILERDLKAAGIQKWAPGGKVDFHALRVAFASLLGGAGVRDVDAMELMRHGSTAMLNRYRKPADERMAAIVEDIGKTVLPGDVQKQKELGA